MTQGLLFEAQSSTVARASSGTPGRSIVRATDPESSPKFGGATFEPKRDQARLNRQLELVFDLVRDGKWRTLAEISAATGQPEASVSARLRDLRKPRFGGWTVERQHVINGLFQYRVRL